MSQITSFFNGSLSLETLTGNSGGAVFPSAGNINILGGTGINVVGNPGTHTLTISGTGTTNLNYVTTISTPYVVQATDDFVSMNSFGGARTVQLPNAPATGRVFVIKDHAGTAGSNNITITTVGGVVIIDGSATFVMNTNYQSIQVIFNGSNYEVF